MTNLSTDEMVFFRNLTEIDTDENKAIYSIRKCTLSQNYHKVLSENKSFSIHNQPIEI